MEVKKIKKNYSLVIFLFLFSNIFSAEYGKDVEVKIKANILKPIRIIEKKDINFGNIYPGKKAETRGQQNGYIIITGEERMYISWKDIDKGKYQSINVPLEVEIKNSSGKIDTKIVAKVEDEKGKFVSNQNHNFMLDGGQGKIVFQGNVDKVPEEAQGEYKGAFLVRIEYRE